MRFGVVQFPGSCDERDTLAAAELVGEAELLWHADRDLRGVDAVLVPGGFSYGDYLRAGAIARFSPVMEAVAEWAAEGGLVLGICNGFQVLCEANLLPGALLPNAGLRFVCRELDLEVVNHDTAFTAACGSERLRIPAKHSYGRYHADPDTLAAMRERGQVLFRYAPDQCPNGSVGDIAGVTSERGNVAGLMPHPEHAVDPLTGSTDGLCVFRSMLAAAEAARA
ncbi:MAG: phosphoribosylformylglycinamidine synthase subunit PurQ [Acidobacteriota bacterium]|nr:phosphoribosylformylglycinamidine synthase subunit PurQ [Acidobacteriota bacterium]